MIGNFFVALFKVEEQSDWYWLQAAKLKEEKLNMRALYTSNPFRPGKKFYNGICEEFQNHLMDTYTYNLRKSKYAFKELESGLKNFATASRKFGEAIQNGFTEISKERFN